MCAAAGRKRHTSIEEIYNLEDALVVAQWLNVFLRKADVLKVACIAQIVNVIAPMLTKGDDLLKQDHLLSAANLQPDGERHTRLDVLVDSPLYETSEVWRLCLCWMCSSAHTMPHKAGTTPVSSS